MKDAIAVWPNGEIALAPESTFSKLSMFCADRVTDGDWPRGTRVFRLPSKMQVNPFRGLGQSLIRGRLHTNRYFEQN